MKFDLHIQATDQWKSILTVFTFEVKMVHKLAVVMSQESEVQTAFWINCLN